MHNASYAPKKDSVQVNCILCWYLEICCFFVVVVVIVVVNVWCMHDCAALEYDFLVHCLNVLFS